MTGFDTCAERPSDSPRLMRPDVLINLELEPCPHLVFKHPFHEKSGREFAEYGGEQRLAFE